MSAHYHGELESAACNTYGERVVLVVRYWWQVRNGDILRHTALLDMANLKDGELLRDLLRATIAKGQPNYQRPLSAGDLRDM